MTHICVAKQTIIGSDNGFAPGRRQAIIWTNAGILLIEPLGTNFSEILIGIQTFSFKKMHLKMSSAKWRPFCFGLNVLNKTVYIFHGAYCRHAALGYCWTHRKFGTRRMRTSRLQLAGHLSERVELESPAPDKCICFYKIWQKLRENSVKFYPQYTEFILVNSARWKLFVYL